MKFVPTALGGMCELGCFVCKAHLFLMAGFFRWKISGTVLLNCSILFLENSTMSHCLSYNDTATVNSTIKRCSHNTISLFTDTLIITIPLQAKSLRAEQCTMIHWSPVSWKVHPGGLNHAGVSNLLKANDSLMTSKLLRSETKLAFEDN